MSRCMKVSGFSFANLENLANQNAGQICYHPLLSDRSSGTGKLTSQIVHS